MQYSSSSDCNIPAHAYHVPQQPVDLPGIHSRFAQIRLQTRARPVPGPTQITDSRWERSKNRRCDVADRVTDVPFQD